MRFFLSLSLIIIYGSAVHGQDLLETARFYKANGLKEAAIAQAVDIIYPDMVSLCPDSSLNESDLLDTQIVNISVNRPSIIRYPILGSNPFPALSGNELKVTAEAYEMAKRLVKDCGCDMALKDYGIPSLKELLKMAMNVDIFNGKKSTLGLAYFDKKGQRLTVGSAFSEREELVGAQVISETFTGRGKVIFLNNYFFNPKTSPTTAFYQRTLILLHESVHQYGNKSDSHFGGSKRLNELLIQRCLPGFGTRLGNLEL
jgi:hypothetical protein